MRYLAIYSLSLVVAAFSAPKHRDDAAEIRKLVFEAQRAGLERHDLEAYMAQWAKDAQVVIGRAEEPGEHDLAVKRSQIEATRRLRFRGDPVPGIKIEYDEVSVAVMGPRAELRVRATVRFDEGFEQVREIYRLRKSATGWKVYENRAWPIQTKYGSRTITFDRRTWDALDAAVRLRRSGDARSLANALFTAYRFREAHEAAKRVTEQEPTTATSWVLRGQIAVFAGDAADSKACFKKALDLDPAVDVPAYARKLSRHAE